LNWVEPGEIRYYGIDFIQEAKEKQHMAAAQSHQKSYANKRRRPLVFEVGDYVYLKVSPMKKLQWFRVKRKLTPRYVGPYRIIERKGPMAYKLQLLEEMSAIFPVFHVSQLKKCLRVPEERVETRNIKLASDLVYEEKLVKILDSKERETRSKTIKLYKVLWSNHDETYATWETESYLKEVYSNFYNKWLVTQNLRTKFF
jgi:hypothetical protein